MPRPAIALVARLLYNENYIALPTRHVISDDAALEVRYEWRYRGHWNRLAATGKGRPGALAEGSEAQFISEHYWGYTTQRDGGTKEYRVEHPPWNTWQTSEVTVDVDVANLYGENFSDALAVPPTSAFIADGSEVTVSPGIRL